MTSFCISLLDDFSLVLCVSTLGTVGTTLLGTPGLLLGKLGSGGERTSHHHSTGTFVSCLVTCSPPVKLCLPHVRSSSGVCRRRCFGSALTCWIVMASVLDNVLPRQRPCPDVALTFTRHFGYVSITHGCCSQSHAFDFEVESIMPGYRHRCNGKCHQRPCTC